MNLTALLTEFYQRGFSYLNDGGAGVTRATRWLNDALHAIEEEEPWTYREATTSGAAPLTISDLGEVIYVANANGPLSGTSVDRLVDESGDSLLTESGSASSFWIDGNVIRVWPLDTGSVTVRYLKVSPDLSGGTDTPLLPARYHNLIVDYAVIRALRDKSNFDEAKALWEAIQPDLARMRATLLDLPMYQRLTDVGAA